MAALDAGLEGEAAVDYLLTEEFRSPVSAHLQAFQAQLLLERELQQGQQQLPLQQLFLEDVGRTEQLTEEVLPGLRSLVRRFWGHFAGEVATEEGLQRVRRWLGGGPDVAVVVKVESESDEEEGGGGGGEEEEEGVLKMVKKAMRRRRVPSPPRSGASSSLERSRGETTPDAVHRILTEKAAQPATLDLLALAPEEWAAEEAAQRERAASPELQKRFKERRREQQERQKAYRRKEVRQQLEASAQLRVNNQLQQSCTSDYDCIRFNSNAKCGAGGRCVCNLGFTVTPGTSTCLRKYCYNDFDCTTSFFNTRCNTDRTCICASGSYLNQLTQTCVSNNYPGGVQYPGNQYPGNQYPGNQYPGQGGNYPQYPQYPNQGGQGGQGLLPPGQLYRCTYDSDCIRYLVNSRCASGSCVCSPGYSPTGNRCEQVRCTSEYDCNSRVGTTCNYITGTCDCDSQHYYDYNSNVCVRRYGWSGSARKF
ncbi:hypothetical protein TYRP_009497 [Tyrophagus putrescentiae]|nr:hypothetical protein TYRP_009497 [Tyrophagus putrescentiae]